MKISVLVLWMLALQNWKGQYHDVRFTFILKYRTLLKHKTKSPSYVVCFSLKAPIKHDYPHLIVYGNTYLCIVLPMANFNSVIRL